MKALIKNETGNTTSIVDISISDTPLSIVKKLCEADDVATKALCMNEEAHHQLQSGTLDQSRSTFSLLAHDNSTMTCEWTRPLCEDPAVKEELAEIEALGTDPVFTVSVCSYVA